MDLGKTLQFVHDLLNANGIDHALIGGLALVTLGLSRATVDLDLIVDEKNKDQLKTILIKNGFNIVAETDDVLQFSGLGYVDVLFARRPISREMMKNARPVEGHNIKCLQPEDIIGLKIQAFSNDPTREFQDKADIQFLMEEYPDMDWEKIRSYADLFGKGEELEEIKNKINS